jgi:glycosyltransferase involved in cell wall biosynthesis
MSSILFYTHFMKTGGAEKVAIQYLNGLIERGYKVDLIIDFNMGKEGNTFEFSMPKKVNYQYIKSEKNSKFTFKLRTLGKKYKSLNVFLYMFILASDFYYYHTKVKYLLKSNNYDWTISFYQFLPAYLTSINQCKHIIWLHGSVEHFFNGITRIFKKSYGKKLDKYDYIVTIADEMKDQINEYFPSISKDKIKKIYNPFDFELVKSKSLDFSAINNDEKRLLGDEYICTVSRLDEHQKDISTLIKAYKKLYNENKIPYKLYIIGDGPDRGSLENLVTNYELNHNIIFIGNQLNPFIWMKSAEIFILSSNFEGLPTVLIEAMAMETFVISSDCKTGPKEILLGGKCGDLFEVGSVDELALKIDYALCNDKFKYNKILKASTRIEEFRDEKILVQLCQLFKK